MFHHRVESFSKFHPTEHVVCANKDPGLHRLKTYIRARKTATAHCVAKYTTSARRFTFSEFSVDRFNYRGYLFLANPFPLHSFYRRRSIDLISFNSASYMLLKRTILVKLDDQIVIDVSVRRVVLFLIEKQFPFLVDFIGYSIY